MARYQVVRDELLEADSASHRALATALVGALDSTVALLKAHAAEAAGAAKTRAAALGALAVLGALAAFGFGFLIFGVRDALHHGALALAIGEPGALALANLVVGALALAVSGLGARAALRKATAPVVA